MLIARTQVFAVRRGVADGLRPGGRAALPGRS